MQEIINFAFFLGILLLLGLVAVVGFQSDKNVEKINEHSEILKIQTETITETHRVHKLLLEKVSKKCNDTSKKVRNSKYVYRVIKNKPSVVK